MEHENTAEFREENGETAVVLTDRMLDALGVGVGDDVAIDVDDGEVVMRAAE